METDDVDLGALPASLQARILGKLNFMDDILTGKIPKPPGMTINAGPSPIDGLLKAVQADMKCKENENKTEEPSSSTPLLQCEPPTKEPSPMFQSIDQHRLESLNQHATNPRKYTLSNAQILELQHKGYVIIDDFIADLQLLKAAQSDIDVLRSQGKMKRAALRKLTASSGQKQNLEITECASMQINGLYERCKDVLSSMPLRTLSGHSEYNIVGALYFHKNDEFGIAKIKTTSKLALFVDSKLCWIVFTCLPSMSFPIVYYVASCAEEKDPTAWQALEWQCIAGISPFGNIQSTNKYLASSIRNDLHCWLHSDDKDIGASLKQCIINVDEVRVQLNKLVAFNSNTTQVQATIYPSNGAQYATHIDEPPDIQKPENTTGTRRRLTCLLYLHAFDDDEQVYDQQTHGGCLRIHLSGCAYEDVQPLGGRVILFNSQWLPHQVMPCYFNRYAVTLWMY